MNYLSNPGARSVDTTAKIVLFEHPLNGYRPDIESDSEMKHFCGQTALDHVGDAIVFADMLRRKDALSYRRFRVGAAAIALISDEYGIRQRFIGGVNSKPGKDGDINVHAEHMVMSTLRAIRQNADVNVPLLTVVGQKQADQESRIETPTLHPCKICRDSFVELNSPIDRDTLIVMATTSLRTFEWAVDPNALCAFHESGGQDRSHMGYVKLDTNLHGDKINPLSVNQEAAQQLSMCIEHGQSMTYPIKRSENAA